MASCMAMLGCKTKEQWEVKDYRLRSPNQKTWTGWSWWLASLGPNGYVNFDNVELVGGLNPFEKYLSKWESSPNWDENKKYLKPPPRCGTFQVDFSGVLGGHISHSLSSTSGCRWPIFNMWWSPRKKSIIMLRNWDNLGILGILYNLG